MFRVVFIIFFIGISIFSRDFAKINIGLDSFPILPAELLILSWLFHKAYTFLKNNKLNRYKFAIKWIITFVIYSSTILLISSINLISIRQYVPFIYVVFIFITYDFIKSLNDIQLLADLSKFCMIILFSLTLINTFFYTFLEATQTSTQGIYYTYIGNFNTVFFVFFFSFNKMLQGQKHESFFVIIAIIWVVFFALHRSALLSIVIPLFVYGGVRVFWKREIRFLVVSTIIIFIFYIFYVNLEGGFQKITEIYNRVTTIFTPQEDYNSAWRLAYWAQILDYLISKPIALIFGGGFGFTEFEQTFTDYNLNTALTSGLRGFHNSYLFILLKMGIIGLIILAMIIKPVFSKVRINDNVVLYWKQSLIAILIFAFFNVVFENPYYGFFIWFYIGILYSYKKLKI